MTKYNSIVLKIIQYTHAIADISAKLETSTVDHDWNQQLLQAEHHLSDYKKELNQCVAALSEIGYSLKSHTAYVM
jgi:hypothetical protein